MFIFKHIALCCCPVAFTLLCSHLHKVVGRVIVCLKMAISSSAQLNHNFFRYCERNSACERLRILHVPSQPLSVPLKNSVPSRILSMPMKTLPEGSVIRSHDPICSQTMKTQIPLVTPSWQTLP